MNTKFYRSNTFATITMLFLASALLTSCGPTTPQNLSIGDAQDFAVLAKAGVSTTGVTSITGDVGLSPAAASYFTGFSETIDESNEFSDSSYVTGHLYASDYANPTPAKLTKAVGDMETAFTNANGIAFDYNELHAGDLSGKTLDAGVYKWGNNVIINTNVTLSGSSSAVWVFQVAGTLTQAANIDVILSGGAKASNIYWVVSDSVMIGTGAHVEGTILGVTDISMGTASSINGRLLAQTAINLDATTVVAPN
ncbi:MAG: ice-binding family protein [Bacilli bacterium]|jgi:hypothetical protein|nr:ice-binding family protein [Bacilli bacterium]